MLDTTIGCHIAISLPGGRTELAETISMAILRREYFADMSRHPSLWEIFIRDDPARPFDQEEMDELITQARVDCALAELRRAIDQLENRFRGSATTESAFGAIREVAEQLAELPSSAGVEPDPRQQIGSPAAPWNATVHTRINRHDP